MRAARWLPLALILPLALPSAASACSCAKMPEARRMQDADAAFTGTLVSRHALDPDPGGVESSGDPFVHRYRLAHRYKGRLSRTVWVRTVRGGEACGLPTRHRVALYLERVHGHWESGLCDVTTRRAMRRVAAVAASSFTTRSQPPELALQQGFCPSSKAKGLLE
jgi:hypothetical protein